jgi:hypothetical protein
MNLKEMVSEIYCILFYNVICNCVFLVLDNLCMIIVQCSNRICGRRVDLCLPGPCYYRHLRELFSRLAVRTHLAAAQDLEPLHAYRRHLWGDAAGLAGRTR